MRYTDNEFERYFKKGCLWYCVIYGILFAIPFFWNYIKLHNHKDKQRIEQLYNEIEEYDDGYVYICTGANSYAYHSDIDCFGLQSCGSSIVKVTIDDALDQERTPCGFCYK